MATKVFEHLILASSLWSEYFKTFNVEHNHFQFRTYMSQGGGSHMFDLEILFLNSCRVVEMFILSKLLVSVSMKIIR